MTYMCGGAGIGGVEAIVPLESGTSERLYAAGLKWVGDVCFKPLDTFISVVSLITARPALKFIG
jgi:hypothetical protein